MIKSLCVKVCLGVKSHFYIIKYQLLKGMIMMHVCKSMSGAESCLPEQPLSTTAGHSLSFLIQLLWQTKILTMVMIILRCYVSFCSVHQCYFRISHLFSLWCHCCHPEDFRLDILLPCQKNIRSILNCDCIQAEVRLRSKYPVSEILQSHKLKSKPEVKYLSGWINT